MIIAGRAPPPPGLRYDLNMLNQEELQARRGERDAMVDTQLIARSIRRAEVLAAMRRLPRERFVPPELAEKAYDDCALAIDFGQTISQPYIVALMTELAEPMPTDRVLEIGTGSGYQTAVLAGLVRHVFTIEWWLGLVRQAAERLESLDISNVTLRCGDGSRGWPEHAPYQAILVAAGAPQVPGALCDQLDEDGVLVIPVGEASSQSLTRVRRVAGRFHEEQVLPCRFVKLVGRHGWRRE